MLDAADIPTIPDFATLAYGARRRMRDTAQRAYPGATMAGKGACRDRAVLDLLSAAGDLMGDEPMRVIVRAYVNATLAEMGGGRGPLAEQAFDELLDALEGNAAAEVIQHFAKLSEAA